MILKETNELENIYKDMVLQFPPKELKPLCDFEELLGENYRLYECIHGKCRAGYFFVFEMKDYILLDYFAIYKNMHAKGFGSMILSLLRDNFSDKKGCFLEVEKPNEQDINTIRRINFYNKNGAVKLDIPYLYPAEDKPFPMDLYYIPFDGKIVFIDETKKFVKALFKCVHKKNPNIENILLEIFCNVE